MMKVIDKFESDKSIFISTFINFYDERNSVITNSYETFCKDLYFSYDHVNLYLSEKYNITENDYKD